MRTEPYTLGDEVFYSDELRVICQVVGVHACDDSFWYTIVGDGCVFQRKHEELVPVSRITQPNASGWWWASRIVGDPAPFLAVVLELPEDNRLDDERFRWYTLGSPTHNPLSEVRWLGPVNPEPLAMPLATQMEHAVDE